MSLGKSPKSGSKLAARSRLERPTGIEPVPHPWEGRVPPQHLGRLKAMVAQSGIEGPSGVSRPGCRLLVADHRYLVVTKPTGAD